MIAYHVRQSFRPGEITPEEANQLGVEFAKRFIPVVNEEPQLQTENTSAEDAPETEKTKE